ncbi:hypothetical protein K502DRAFT_351276 [Neoconidiobolus thromboides FSU 785]|nr:hypothetical protein K502DRAFT_351276 [Neoconidiobolus thromboides FSU 785]
MKFKNCIVYLDNSSFHGFGPNQLEFQNSLNQYNIELIFYPPYSIFMNPIEYFFNEIYKYIKDQAFKTREQLIYLIENGIVRNTEQEKIQLFIDKANSFNQLCLNGEPINGFMLPDNQLKSI